MCGLVVAVLIYHAALVSETLKQVWVKLSLAWPLLSDKQASSSARLFAKTNSEQKERTKMNGLRKRGVCALR